MKIVIDIQKDAYEEICESCKFFTEFKHNPNIYQTIANGTPLPKGYGRLIDADAYQTKLEEKAKRLNNLDTINGLCGAVALLSDTETIIEADKGE